MNLTEHFAEDELGVSGASDVIITNARALCRDILEPIRAHYQVPIAVHDGYRNVMHNANVGGKPNSYHLYEAGHAAADFHVEGVPMTQVFNWIRSCSNLPFDKVILEHTFDNIPRCIHVQINVGEQPRRLAYIGSTGDGQKYERVEVA
jgi:zinc D-Ala-D-Ala carboxypeptidase